MPFVGGGGGVYQPRFLTNLMEGYSYQGFYGGAGGLEHFVPPVPLAHSENKNFI